MFSTTSHLIRRLHKEKFIVSSGAANLRLHAWVASVLAAPIYAAFAVANQIIYGAPVMAAPPAIASTLAVCALVMLKKSDHASLAGHFFTTALATQVFGEMVFNGGLQAPAAALCLLVIPAAIVTAGARAAVLWTIITMGTLSAIGAMDVFGLLPANELAANAQLIDRMFSLFAGMLVSAALVLLFERQANTAIDRLREERSAFEYQALHDGLTGMPNRTHFHDHAQAAINKAKQSLTGCILFYFDIDRFKQINDQLGHAAGDKLLTTFSARLSERVRPGDLAARLAGDEFAMMVETSTENAATPHILQRLRSVTNDPFELDGNSVQVGISIGYASFPADGDDLDTLIRVADGRMYADKSARRQVVTQAGIVDNVIPFNARSSAAKRQRGL